MVYTTQSSLKTNKLGQQIAKTLKPGATLALYGELGAGKTTFVQGLAKGLGVKGSVNSPTFVMVKPYGRLVHVDLYRVKSVQDAESTGLRDYLGSPNHIVVIEWPEKIEEILPENTKRVYFKTKNETDREITIDRYHKRGW